MRNQELYTHLWIKYEVGRNSKLDGQITNPDMLQAA